VGEKKKKPKKRKSREKSKETGAVFYCKKGEKPSAERRKKKGVRNCLGKKAFVHKKERNLGGEKERSKWLIGGGGENNPLQKKQD